MNTKQKAFVGYRQAHRRVEQARGKAFEWDCACGCGEPAREWALIPGTDELYWEVKPETGKVRPYSLDVNAYQPMAIVCHRILDDTMPPVGGRA